MTQCEYIDYLLKKQNLSRRKLAIAAGIAPSSFQSAMQRNTDLSLDMLFPISDVLNVSVEDIINCGNAPIDLSLPPQTIDIPMPTPAELNCLKECDAIISLIQNSLISSSTSKTISTILTHTYHLLSDIIDAQESRLAR